MAAACPAGEHDFAVEPHRLVADHGPMEGEWLVWECRHCNAFELKAVGSVGDESFTAFVAALAAAGCDPHTTAPNDVGDGDDPEGAER